MTAKIEGEFLCTGKWALIQTPSVDLPSTKFLAQRPRWIIHLAFVLPSLFYPAAPFSPIYFVFSGASLCRSISRCSSFARLTGRWLAFPLDSLTSTDVFPYCQLQPIIGRESPTAERPQHHDIVSCAQWQPRSLPNDNRLRRRVNVVPPPGRDETFSLGATQGPQTRTVIGQAGFRQRSAVEQDEEEDRVQIRL
jgi:hypothetical protein